MLIWILLLIHQSWVSINKQMQKLIDDNNKEYEKLKKLLKEEDDILKKEKLYWIQKNIINK